MYIRYVPTTGLTIIKSPFLIQNFQVFMRFTEQTGIITMDAINKLFFVTQTKLISVCLESIFKR
jgi:hypothetical protein